MLDAVAIATSFAQRDPKTAGETMFLLQLGETMEAYTEARSESALIDALLDVAETANKVEGDVEIQVSAASLQQGDLIAIRTGMPIVVDGSIESGIAMVNQSSLTGEPLAIERTVGDDVFTGTTVEDGEILVRCKSGPGESRLRSIVLLVKNAGLYQSDRQKRRERLANRFVAGCTRLELGLHGWRRNRAHHAADLEPAAQSNHHCAGARREQAL